MFYKEIIPQSSLQQHIKCFWVFENSYGDNHFERMLPDGFIDLVFHYGQKPKLVIDGKEITKPSNFLGGHLVSSALLHFSGELKMFGIKFYPWATASLYKMPAYELNNLRIPVSEILGAWVNEYQNLMMQELNKGSYLWVVQQLEKVLQVKLFAPSNHQKLIKSCFEKIYSSQGKISVEEAGFETGYSSRYIQKLFERYKGKSFQYYCRLSRLHYALQYSKLKGSPSFTDLAYEAGYYDQSHFIKDFTGFTGLTPSAFFAQENSYIHQHAGAASGLH